MSQPLTVLKRTEGEIAALLVAGLATQRGGRQQLEELAGEVSALKMERLAVELRNLAREQDPTAAANSAFTALVMARKFQERLTPWPEVDPKGAIPFVSDPSVQIALPDGSPSVQDLLRWMESGNELLRTHAAALLVQRGEEALPELARLAARSTVTVGREAIAAMGKIGGEAALGTLVDLLGDAHCWRALLQAMLPGGQAAVPLLAGVLAADKGKKGRETGRLMAAALLYQLGAYPLLERLLKEQDEDPVVQGFAVASRARATEGWREPPEVLEGIRWDRLFPTLATVGVARAEVTGDLGPLIELLDKGAINEVRTVARWAICGSPMEGALAEHYLGQLTASRSKDRDRAASVLRGLACPALVPSLASLLEAKGVAPGAIAEILAETGGSHAVGILLDLARGDRLAAEEALKGLRQLGDPGSAPALLELLATSPNLASVEAALISLGDGAVDFLAQEMRARESTPLAGRIQQVLLQMNSPRAREALKGTKTDSVEALLSQLGHPKLGAGAAKALARHGETVLDPLERVLASNNLTARLNALGALGSIKGPRAYEILCRVVEQSLRSAGNTAESTVCVRGIELLAKHREPRTVALLVKGLATGMYNVQEASIRALTKVGGDAVPSVMPLLGDADPSIRAKALEVLGKLEAVEAEEKGMELLSDSNRQVQMAAVAALGSIGAITGNPRVVEALGTTLLREPDWWPLPTFEALVRINQRAALPYLRRFAEEAPRKFPSLGQYLQQQAREAIRKIEAASPAPVNDGVMGTLRRFLGGK